MKQLFLFCGFMFFAAMGNLHADQLAYVTEAQAKIAVKYLTDNKVTEVIAWCACCEGETKTKVQVTKVSYRYTGYEKFYEVVIEGTTSEGKKFNEAVDLAYVHIKVGKRAKCFGKLLKFECDPCTPSFKF